jgi:hypothetical protein
MSDKKSKTQWHVMFGTMLEYLLTPVGIQVQIEVPIASEPPKADVILLRRQTPTWTEEQRELLPDGIRDATARYILLEFKYTESVSLKTVKQIIGYDFFYRQAQNLKAHDLQSFIISAKTTQQKTLDTFSYHETQHKGVYHSTNPIIQDIPLLSLNDLDDTIHNAWIRSFASKQAEKRKALQQMSLFDLNKISTALYRFLFMWFQVLLSKRGAEMNHADLGLTPEDFMNVAKHWHPDVFTAYNIDEFFNHFRRDEIANHLTVEERLEGLAPKERLEGLAPKERLEGLAPKERLEGLAPKERLEGLAPKERLEGLTPEQLEQMEACLQEMKNRTLH